MATRKSIGDRDGDRSLYVVEIDLGGGFSPIYWRECGFRDHRNAVEVRDQIYQDGKCGNPKTRRKDFRVQLYARVED